MRLVLPFVGLFVIGISAIAQPYTSRLGRFQVDEIRGCAPFTVNIKNTNLSGNGGCTAGTPCSMSPGDPSQTCPAANPSCLNVIQFTYANPGTYKLTVTYQNTGSDDIMITVDPNIQPAFDIYTCAGDQVFINITDKSYDKYNIDFDGNGTYDLTIPSGNNQTVTYNYGIASKYNIRVQGQKVSASNNCTPKVQPFTSLAALPIPTLKALTAVDASTLQLAFTPQPNIEYKAEIAFNNAANFQTYQTLYNVSTMTASGLNVDASYYCFRLTSFDPCANTNTYSSNICSHKFSLALASGSDQLAWQTSSSGVSSIQINRNSTALTTLPATTTSYADNAVICKTDYCYQLVSDYGGGITSTSLKKCGTAFSTTAPTAINNTSAVVNGSQVDLKWLQDPAFTTAGYNVLREQVGGAFSLNGTSTTTQYTDDTYGTGGYCYEVDYTDKCDNKSGPGLTSCPMRLSGRLDQTNNVNLDWSSYKGWNQGVNTYTVQKSFQPGQGGQVVYAGPDSTYIDTQQDVNNQVVYYRILATPNESGVTSSISNEIKVIKSVNLFSPTAFNPESNYVDPITKEKVNRTFIVRGHYVASLKLQIFDRWGSLIFFSDKDEAWDGRKDGVAMPDGTYVWTADGTDLIGNSFKKAGVVVLLRK